MIDLNLKELSTEDLKNLERKIKYETTEREEKKIKEIVKKHDSLIGKCFKAKIHTPYILFPEMWKYYKIINSRASNEYRVSALIFEEYPTYWFYYDIMILKVFVLVISLSIVMIGITLQNIEMLLLEITL